MPTFMQTLRDVLREEATTIGAIAGQSGCDPAYLRRLYWGEKENPSAQTCERIGYAVGAVGAFDYDSMVSVTNRLLLAAGLAPLQVQRRRRRSLPPAV